MIQSISKYKTIIFDCDGVLLNSNRVKAEAFYRVAKPYGESAAQKMVDYHMENGGISRYKKFAYFLENMVTIDPNNSSSELEDLLKTYADLVLEGLLVCDIANGLQELRHKTEDSRWLIVSGGDQEELRFIFATRGIDQWFDGGIFGSPDAKDIIIARELSLKNIEFPALFIGDSKYDFHVATEFSLDFVFISEWSDVVNWSSWTQVNEICHSSTVASLLENDLSN